MLKYLKIKTVFFLLMGGYSSAAESHRFDQATVGYFDFNSMNETVFFEIDGKVHWLVDDRIGRSVQYAVRDEECRPRKEDSMSGKGLTLAWPYLVGVDRVCELEAETKSIRLLAKVKTPENAYASMFLMQNESYSYFVVLGRPWESTGYLKLWTIEKRTGTAQLTNFIGQLKGYSGGLWRTGDHLYVTLSFEDVPFEIINKIYRADLSKLRPDFQRLLNDPSKVNDKEFYSIFEEVQGPFEGFSFSIAGRVSDWLVYFNEGYESFLFNINSAEKRILELEEGCVPHQISETRWSQLCSEHELKPLLVGE